MDEFKSYPCLEKFRADQEFRALLHRKIAEALSHPEPIFWWAGCYFFADGELRYDHPNLHFEPYTPDFMFVLKSLLNFPHCPFNRVRSDNLDKASEWRGKVRTWFKEQWPTEEMEKCPESSPLTDAGIKEMESAIRERWRQDHPGFNFEHNRCISKDLCENEEWFKEYWDEHPEASLADAIREKERVTTDGGGSTPQEEAEKLICNVILISENDGWSDLIDPVRGCEIHNGRPSVLWAHHYALRGEEFLMKKYRYACRKHPALFAQACRSTVEALKNAPNDSEINTLQAIQKIMLEVLREGVNPPGAEGEKPPEINAETKRRMIKAIKALEKALGVKNITPPPAPPAISQKTPPQKRYYMDHTDIKTAFKEFLRGRDRKLSPKDMIEAFWKKHPSLKPSDPEEEKKVYNTLKKYLDPAWWETHS